jgi:hypothetical protein
MSQLPRPFPSRTRRGGTVTELLAATALLAGGCGARHPGGPAWPQSAGRVSSADWSEDGGESIEPRSPAATVERAVEVDAKLDDLAVAEVAADAPAAAVEAPSPAEPESDASDASDAVDLGETIIIEIED